MFDAEKAHSVLIVLPVAVITNWEKEFEKWYNKFFYGFKFFCINELRIHVELFHNPFHGTTDGREPDP